jgi:hypothetical protein
MLIIDTMHSPIYQSNIGVYALFNFQAYESYKLIVMSMGLESKNLNSRAHVQSFMLFFNCWPGL